MLLRRLIAFPESRRILRMYLWSTPFLAVQTGVFVMVPVLLRKHFEANVWQIAAATSAGPVMSLLAIFWNEVYRRRSPRVYLLIFWLCSVVPMGAIAFCDRPGTVLVFVLLSAAGMGGIRPLSGDLLRSCFPPSTRSRVWSALSAIEQLTIMLTAFAVGYALDWDPFSYRIYFPIVVVLIGAGLLLIERITRQQLFVERLQAPADEPLLFSLRSAYRNMTRVLADDPDFRRYETAFCIYGLGWMICASLLPFVQVDILRLRYGQAAWSTQVAFQITLMIPVGYMMDRVGPIRVSSWSFLCLILYPFGLMMAWDVFSLMAASIIYGIGMAGVSLAWTLGPVTLARDASQAPHYLAIHATLVAVRAILGQLPAVAIYRYTHNIHIPLIIAAVMFIVGSILMIRLDREKRAVLGGFEVVPVPATQTSVA